MRNAKLGNHVNNVIVTKSRKIFCKSEKIFCHVLLAPAVNQCQIQNGGEAGEG